MIRLFIYRILSRLPRMGRASLRAGFFVLAIILFFVVKPQQAQAGYARSYGCSGLADGGGYYTEHCDASTTNTDDAGGGAQNINGDQYTMTVTVPANLKRGDSYITGMAAKNTATFNIGGYPAVNSISCGSDNFCTQNYNIPSYPYPLQSGTTSLTLTITITGGHDHAEGHIYFEFLKPQPPVITCGTSANPLGVGQTTYGSFNAQNASRVIVSWAGGTIYDDDPNNAGYLRDYSGSNIAFAPNQNSTLTFEAYDKYSGQAAYCTKDVTYVAPSVTAQILDYQTGAWSPSYSYIHTYNQPDVQWSSTNATSMTVSYMDANGNYCYNTASISVAANSYLSACPSQYTIFTFTVYGPGGSTAYQIVSYYYPPTVSASLYNYTTGAYGGSSSYIHTNQKPVALWNSTDADRVVLNGYTVGASGNSYLTQNQPVSGVDFSPAQTSYTKYTFTAVGYGGSSNPVDVYSYYYSPTATSFTASPSIVEPGASSTLAWSGINDATRVWVDGIGEVAAGNGSGSVTPTQPSTTYCLWLLGPGSGGAWVKYWCLNVDVYAPTATFTVNGQSTSPQTYDLGSDLKFAWQVQHSRSTNITDIGDVVANGTKTLTATKNQTYTLTASDYGGTVVRQITIKIPPPTLTFTASIVAPATAQTFKSGDSVKLTWSATNTTSVATSGFSASTVVCTANGKCDGSTTVQPHFSDQLGRYVFTMTVYGPSGSVSVTRTISIAQTLPSVIQGSLVAPELDFFRNGQLDINYDANIQKNPPPGFTNLIQPTTQEGS